MKKLFTFFLALVVSVGTMFAESGTCGENLTWDLTNGVLTISGTGEMTNWSSSNDVPWHYSSSITNVIIGDSVTNIGDYAFFSLKNMTSVTIGNSVTSISNQQPFDYCDNLTNVIWNAKNCVSGGNFGYQVESFTFGNEVESIPARCCSGMNKLTSIEIPNSVTSIGDEAFYYCSGLTSPVYNAHVFAYMPTSYSGAYTIPDGIESIAGSAFSGCSGLTSVTIPDGVTSIGYGAFSGCSGLTSVVIPSSVTRIEGSILIGCGSLRSLKVLNPNVEYKQKPDEDGDVYYLPVAYYKLDSLRVLSVPAQCLPINPEYTAYTFYYPQQLDTIEITGGELSKETWWMISLSRKTLRSVDLSSTTHIVLADEAFKEFYNLLELKLPAGLTKINYMAVAGCKNLQSIDIPASVEEIEQSAFEDCRSLKSITFGGSANPAPGRFNAPAASASQLKKIGNWAFYNAHELQNLVIPEGVTEIGDGAFYGCTYLGNLSLPSSVQAIGDNCFALCSKLKKIVVNSLTPPTIQTKTFYDVNRQIPVYVPDEVVAQYENDPLWGEFDIQGVSEMPEGIETVESQGSKVDSRKIIRDGQVFILRGAKVYTLQGQEIR